MACHSFARDVVLTVGKRLDGAPVGIKVAFTYQFDGEQAYNACDQ